MITYFISAVLTVSVLHYAFGFSVYRCAVGLLFAAAVLAVLGLGGKGPRS